MNEMNTPFVAIVDGVVERLDRINRRLIAIIIILVVLLVGSNVAWLVYESQFTVETTETEIEALQLGERNLVSGGDMYYGTNSQGEDEND